jgi:hypothetical protein
MPRRPDHPTEWRDFNLATSLFHVLDLAILSNPHRPRAFGGKGAEGLKKGILSNRPPVC